MNQIDELIRYTAVEPSTDERAELAAIDSARRSLRTEIATELSGRRGRRSRRRLIAVFAVAGFAGIAVPAFGVANGWFGGGAETEGVRGSAAPQLTSRRIIVASGKPNEAWTIAIARSDQGLCLNVDVGDETVNSRDYGLGDCGYLDIRGDLPTDVRGELSAPCIGSTAPVPCGSRQKYWIAVRSWGTFVPQARRSILIGAAAANVASVEVVLANGQTLRAKLVRRPLGADVPLTVYWAEFGRKDGLKLRRNALGELRPCSANLVREVVARDSEGKVLGRRVPAWNGNPTGDQNGPRPPLPHDPGSCV